MVPKDFTNPFKSGKKASTDVALILRSLFCLNYILLSALSFINFCVRLFSCHPNAKCVNTEGHFECQCTEVEKPDCRLSCMFEDNEIPDGGKVSPRNQPCKVCTCSRGVITCEETSCNCSTWRRGSGRDLCCPQCDPRESCQHQELKHVTFRSGEQWIYQCQTCECLVSVFVF